MSSPGSVAQASKENHMRFPRRYAVALLIASGLASMLVLPYNIEKIRRNTRPESAIVWKPAEFAVYIVDKNGDVDRVAPLDVVVKVLPDIAFSLVAIFLGLRLGPAVTLAWPPLAGWGVGPRQFRRTTATLLLAAASGLPRSS